MSARRHVFAVLLVLLHELWPSLHGLWHVHAATGVGSGAIVSASKGAADAAQPSAAAADDGPLDVACAVCELLAAAPAFDGTPTAAPDVVAAPSAPLGAVAVAAPILAVSPRASLARAPPPPWV